MPAHVPGTEVQRGETRKPGITTSHDAQENLTEKLPADGKNGNPFGI